MARKQCFLVCLPSVNMTRNRCLPTLSKHGWETMVVYHPPEKPISFEMYKWNAKMSVGKSVLERALSIRRMPEHLNMTVKNM